MRSVITREVGVNGEIIKETETVTRFVKTPRYDGPWQAMMMFSGEGIEELDARLKERRLGMQAVRVLVAMCKSVKVHTDNRVRAGRKDLAKSLAMREGNVSGAIKQLVDCGFIEKPKLKFDAYTLSPRFFWYGTSDALRVALKERGMLGEDGMMKPADKRAA